MNSCPKWTICSGFREEILFVRAVHQHRLRLADERGIAHFEKMRQIDEDIDVKPGAPAFIVGIGGAVHIRCGICGAPFGHKITGSAPKYKKAVWICGTFNTLGKAHCPSQQIPDAILQAKVAEAGGMKGLVEIIVPGPFLLSFTYKGNVRVDLTWAHPSRRDSWTQEMKEEARRRSSK